MEVIQTPSTKMVYRGNSPGVGDLPCWREEVESDGTSDDTPTAIFAVYEPSADERVAIAAGCNLKLGIWYQEPIPPVSLAVTDEGRVDGG